jgi:hypothetical protein
MNRVLNLIGLVLNLAGVLILFRYGMPFHVPTGGAVSLITEQLDQAEIALEHRLHRLWVYWSRLLNRGNDTSDGNGLASRLESRTSAEGYEARDFPHAIYFLYRMGRVEEIHTKCRETYSAAAGDCSRLLRVIACNLIRARL